MNTSRNTATQYEQREFNLPGTGSYRDEAKKDRRMDQDNYMPTGIYVKPNEQVTIEVSGSQKIRTIIGTHQYEITGGKAFELSPGSNTISSPNGGVLGFDNYQDTGTVKVKVIHGGNFVPLFELGKHTKTDWIRMLEKYSEVHAVQLKSKKAVLIVSHESAKKYIVNQDPIPLLKKYDEMIQAQDKISGLSETDANPLHRSTRRLWTFIENTYSPNWGMYASRDGAVFTTAGEAIKSSLDVNDFGWGQFHEAGHTRQQYPWIWNDLRGMTEVTVNVYSLAAQKRFSPNQPTRLEIEGDYDRAFAYLKQTNKEYKDIDDLWVKLVMLWQLHLAYGEEFYPDLHRLYRELPESSLPQTDEDKIQAFIYNTSKVAKQNLLPFFDQWGLKATLVTRKNVEALNFPVLIDPIWEATDSKPVEILKDGDYFIFTKLAPTLGIVGGNNLATINHITNLPDQKFKVTWDKSKQAYTIIQEVNNRKLALSFESKSEEIVFKDFDAEDLTQYWKIKLGTNQAYVIEPLTRSSMCMDIWTSAEPGSKISLYAKNGGNNQQWYFTTKYSNRHLINQKVAFFSCMMDVSTKVITQNKNLELQGNNDEAKQGFLLKFNQEKEAFQIWDIDSKLILTWDHKNVLDSTQLNMQPNEGKDEQYWLLEQADPLSPLKFYITSYKDTRKVLDLPGGNTANGTPIILYNKKQDQIIKNQQFFISDLELYDEFDGKGKKLLFTPNSQWNDRISSVRVPPYSTVDFWEHGGFKGKYKSVRNDSNIAKIFNLTDFNNIASSFTLYINNAWPKTFGNENTEGNRTDKQRAQSPDSIYEMDRKTKNITLNFYDSTCNIFVNDNYNE
ncbi:M60 family metallopeptidase [Bacillus toyonensis]|uniref:M60 family metallopeptidase n=1 Tax=Bacillus toyonensis TaxID=155322 RepID=UPI003219B3D4